MKRYDQHMHTHFSPDSEETLANYLKISQGTLVTTEHLDFHDFYNNEQDTVLDYDAYSATIAQLEATSGRRIRKGLEVGFTVESKEKILAYLEGKEFDVLLLSVHQNGRYDYLQPVVKKKEVRQVMHEYFGLLLIAIQHFPQANILSHFDYGIRLFDVTLEEFQKHKTVLTAILKRMKTNKIALELNTRSMYEYGNVALDEQMIEWYVTMGGQRFSIGSDAHSVAHYGFHFKDAIALLKKHCVTKIAVYDQQHAIFKPI